MRIVLPPPDQSVSYEDVDWAELQVVLAEIGERSGVRIAYDRGKLELMSPASDHEGVISILGQLVEVLCDLERIDYVCLGALTMLRPDLERGVEPDRCYYIANARSVLMDRKVDLTRDPPPDLVIEVDTTRRSLPRFPIYAALGVPEVWRHRRGRVAAFHHRQTGAYEPVERSLAFPWLRVADLSPFVERRSTHTNLEIKEAFREWVRDQLGRSG